MTSDSILIPIMVGHDGMVTMTDATDSAILAAAQEKKQVFLVHLRVGQMAVTVYTSEAFADERAPEAATNDDILDDAANSDELSEAGDEFSVPQASPSAAASQIMGDASFGRGMTMKPQPVGLHIAKEEKDTEGKESVVDEDSVVDEAIDVVDDKQLSNSKSIVHLISDFVIELLESLEVPEDQIEELAAKLEVVSNLERPEDLMVHLCEVARRIIDGENPAEDKASEAQIRLQAAKMTLSFLALLS